MKTQGCGKEDKKVCRDVPEAEVVAAAAADAAQPGAWSSKL